MRQTILTIAFILLASAFVSESSAGSVSWEAWVSGKKEVNVIRTQESQPVMADPFDAVILRKQSLRPSKPSTYRRMLPVGSGSQIYIGSGTVMGNTKKVIKKSGLQTYTSPQWEDTIYFSVSVKDGVIVSAIAIPKSKGVSGQLQKSFAKGLSKAVVGKQVAGLSLDAIGGASLTTAAFEQFIAKSF